MPFRPASPSLEQTPSIKNNRMRYFFPIHLDGGNRGCEAIAKGSALLLGSEAKDCIGLCRDIALDERLGLRKFVTLVAAKPISFVQKVARKIRYVFARGEKAKTDVLMSYDYGSFLGAMRKGDVMLSTGGDMMCYTNNQVNFTNDLLHRKGYKTILWGCSMGPENLTPEKQATLKRFSLVYARESLSEEFFRGLGLKNVCRFPDPAFILEPEPCDLPKCFEAGDVIALNISNYVLGGFSLETPFGREVIAAIDMILAKTDLQILLVPHVMWPDQDDRVVAKLIAERYQTSDRVSILDSNALNYCQIRYVISKCKFFVGARTHAVISAYSTCVPTLALGYSIKSKGIAKDLGLDSYLVVDSKKFVPGAFASSLERMIAEGDTIRKHLESVVPVYKEKTYGIRQVLKENDLV